MDRRKFIGTVTGGLLAAPLAGEAQAPGKVARIGYLSSGTATENARLHKAFTDGLRDYGWFEGKNIAIEYRWDVTGETTLDALAAELVQLPLDVIFAVNTPAALATKRTALGYNPVSLSGWPTFPGSPSGIIAHNLGTLFRRQCCRLLA